VGLPDYTVSSWYGIWAPKGTPADVQAHVADEVRKAMRTEDLKAIWANQGAEFPDMTQQQFAAFIDSEVKRWKTVVAASNVKAD
jgi:tripartite-type tricarboxylate transporter receptor subunit TctC